jgi:ATP-dependent RNA helicase SUPV3L1/SUV3
MGGLGYGSERGERVKAKPVVAVAPAAVEAAPVVEVAGEDGAGEDMAGVAAEVVAEPVAGPEAEAAPESVAEPVGVAAVEAEAPEMEVFYTFRWVPKKRVDTNTRPRNAAPQGANRGKAAPEGGFKGKAKGKGKRPARGDKPQTAKPAPRKDKPIDPDNPFAALMALKGKN